MKSLQNHIDNTHLHTLFVFPIPKLWKTFEALNRNISSSIKLFFLKSGSIIVVIVIGYFHMKMMYNNRCNK